MHLNEEIFEYAVIDADRYDRRLRDARLETNYGDFGIFSEILMYRTIDEIEGTGEFTEDKELIDRYVIFHREAMGAYDEMGAEAKIQNALRELGKISEEDFLNADKT